MTKPPIQLPSYPAAGGPGTARQTDTHVDRYRQRIAVIQREIADCETAFELALARADAAAITRTRIDELAASARRSTNR